MARLILASSSPRRKEILEKANISFIVIEPNADETQFEERDPRSMVMQLARKKALSVMENADYDDIVLGVDTIVYDEGRVLGKPCCRQDAKDMIKSLSNKTHLVISGVCILQKNGFEKVFACETLVEFGEIDDEEINEYVLSDEPYDKAGGYAIQGLASKFVKNINGCFYNVMGLPLSAVYSVIKNM